METEYGFAAGELKRLRARRALPYIRFGHKSIRYKRRDVLDFIERHRVAAIGER
ncbi:hypothetical protein ACFLSJ_04585 [Verrucomicrobiota bacterium]